MLNSKFSTYLVGNYGANFSCVRVDGKCSIRWVMPLRIEDEMAPVELLTHLGIHCKIAPVRVGVPNILTAVVSIEEPLDQWVLKGLEQLSPTEEIPQEKIDELKVLLKQE